MASQAAILVKVDKEMKMRMKDVKINWSAEIRRFIETRISENKERRLAEAVMLTDRIYYSRKKSRHDSAEIIRKFRDERYGQGSR